MHRHTWHLIERRSHGVLFKAFACRCKQLRAYDMEIFNRKSFQGSNELQERSQRQ